MFFFHELEFPYHTLFPISMPTLSNPANSTPSLHLSVFDHLPQKGDPSLSPGILLTSSSELCPQTHSPNSRTTITLPTASPPQLSLHPTPVPLLRPQPQNTLTMQTSSKSGIFLPKVYTSAHTTPSCFLTETEPTSVQLALQDPK
ncbi:hypothetical protein ACOSQ3_012458 [Xanthoceras sorbifolium]